MDSPHKGASVVETFSRSWRHHPKSWRHHATDLLDENTANQTLWLSSSNWSAWPMKRGCWSYARMEETPFRVSVKLANTGDRLMDSILFTWRAVATYIRWGKEGKFGARQCWPFSGLYVLKLFNGSQGYTAINSVAQYSRAIYLYLWHDFRIIAICEGIRSILFKKGQWCVILIFSSDWTIC